MVAYRNNRSAKKNNGYILPADIEKKIKNKRAATIIFSLAWYILLLALFIYAQVRVTELDSLGMPMRGAAGAGGTAKAISGVIFVLIYFYVPLITFRPQRLFFEKNWTGVIIKKEINEQDFKPSKQFGAAITPTRSLALANPVDLIILTVGINNSENIVQLKYKFSDEKIRAMDLYYNAGDEIVHYKWIKYCKKAVNMLEKGNNKPQRMCIVCGYLNYIDMEHCKECRSSIIG